MIRNRLALAAAALLAAALPGGSAGQSPTRLIGTVGPGFTITLTDANGNAVSQLQPGAYVIEVDDRSDMHNFHLAGPGVNEATSVPFVGRTTWNVTLQNGRYTFVCDPHPDTMRGAFTAGTPPAQTPTTPTTPRPTTLPRLFGSVGPGFTISLRNAAGGRVSSVRAGTYTIFVRDRSAMHNFHLVGPGVNRRTSVLFRGAVTWRVRFRAGATYRFVCDPHARGMRGSFRGRR